MLLSFAILIAVVAVALVLWAPAMHRWTTWRAMTTPLASIIGSGFLVLGPILDHAYGLYAPLVMAGLCLGAWLYGAAIRYNMAVYGQDKATGSQLEKSLETAASALLGFAYMISVAYYLNLFGSFAVSLTDANNTENARIVTTAIYIVIVTVGWRRGFAALEAMEYASVTAKLAIIAGLLLGLGVYFFGKATDGGLIWNAPLLTGWPAITLAFGLIVTVQGFETSRYLGDEYDTKTRIASMRLAQWVSSGIYLAYILLIAYVFHDDQLKLTETAIVDMMRIVAPILPVLLVAAALAAQFSAAVADTSGSGGLVSELTRGKLSPRQAYAVLTAIGLALTWTVDLFEIIAYASRAFAGYYAVQAAIAALHAHRAGDSRARTALFLSLAIIGVAIVIFGQPAEGA